MRRIYSGTVVDGTEYKHSVLRITTRAGEKYALDMTGTQFGWTESILPWDLFADTRILSFDGIEAFGYTKPFMEAKCSSHGERRAYVHYIHKVFRDALNSIIFTWQEANMLLPTLLVLPYEKFEQQQQALIVNVEDEMQRFRKFAISTDQFPFMRGDPSALLPGLSKVPKSTFEKLSM